jgi:hypothetical protein
MPARPRDENQESPLQRYAAGSLAFLGKNQKSPMRCRKTPIRCSMRRDASLVCGEAPIHRRRIEQTGTRLAVIQEFLRERYKKGLRGKHPCFILLARYVIGAQAGPCGRPRQWQTRLKAVTQSSGGYHSRMTSRGSRQSGYRTDTSRGYSHALCARLGQRPIGSPNVRPGSPRRAPSNHSRRNRLHPVGLHSVSDHCARQHCTQ